jgi:tyrosinase
MSFISLTRRQALIGAGAAIAAGAVTELTFGPVLAATIVRKRKNIEALTADELSSYEHAIKILKDRSNTNANDTTGYAYWASLHDTFDESIRSGCTHFSEKFFPWHRRYLFDFEVLLQQTDPTITSNVTIPYWDWTKPPQGKHFPAAFERQASPLFDSRLSLTPPPWDPNDLHDMIQEPDWNAFAGKPDPSNGFGQNPGSIEHGPHNTLHTNISRHMRNPGTAVQDPIFWSFHAFIDLIWSRWQRLHVSNAKPQPFADPSAIIWFRDRSFRVDSTASTTDYNYEYDYDFSIDGTPVATVAAAEIRSIMLPPKRLTAFATAAAKGESVTMSPAANNFKASTLLRLVDVKVFANRSYRLKLYLHPRSVDPSLLDPESRGRYLIRTITLWQAHHDGKVELFVRLSAQQLSDLNEGWVVTIRSEVIPNLEETAAHEHATLSMTAELPATSELVKSLEIQER